MRLATGLSAEVVKGAQSATSKQARLLQNMANLQGQATS
jgi:hypothetical protein